MPTLHCLMGIKMKRIGKKIIPLFLALLILVGVPLSSFEDVKATGAEELLYYTYWDLLNSVFAAQGYKMSVKEDVVKNHGVTGKQVWNNFKVWAKENAQDVYKEVTLLPKAVTAEGIKMSQKLWDAFKQYTAYCASSTSDLYVKTDHFNMKGVLNSVLPFKVNFDYPVNTRDYSYIVYVVMKGNAYSAAYVQPMKRASDGDSLDHASIEDGTIYLYTKHGNTASAYVGDAWYMSSDGSSGYNFHSVYSYSHVSGYSGCHAVTLWVDGVTVNSNSDVYSMVAQGACPAEVPDVTPWIKSPDIPDEWRVVHPNETPNPDDNNDGDALPVIIPIHPTPEKPGKPDGTEKEDSTEKPDNDLGVLINPSTGNQIDPNTGLDIDPDTGYLVDPDTGELIDPKTGKKVDKDKIKNRVKNLPSIVDRAGNITKYFPFCIPWDMMELVKTLKADKKTPRFTFKYTFKEINYTWVVDVNMADYWKYIKIFRWGMTIFFIIGLFFLTTKITTFVHRMSG